MRDRNGSWDQLAQVSVLSNDTWPYPATRESSECLATVFADKLRTLHDKGFTELESLPETDEEVVKCRDGVFSLTTHRYLIDAGQLSIVLQAHRSLILGAGTMLVEGFRRLANETTTPLPQDEWAKHS